MAPAPMFCVICGGWFQDIVEQTRELALHGQRNLQGFQTEWLRNFRVIGKSSFTGMRESPNQPFSISPPAQETYARSCSIAGHASAYSLWARHDRISWRLFDMEVENPPIPLLPIHDTCIAMVQIVATNHASGGLSSVKNFTSLENYYNALTRLFERLTEWPSEQPELITQLEEVGASPTGYGSQKLEWEHGSYGWDFGSLVDWIERDSEWVCADPFIPNSTSYILSKLRPFEPDEASDCNFFARPRNLRPSNVEILPTEILERIASLSGTTSYLRLRRCSQAVYAKLPVTQSFWCQALISGDLVEYLWDLDASACLQKNQQQLGSPRGGWDWKLLAQNLRQPIIMSIALGNNLRILQRQLYGSETATTGLNAFEKRCVEFCTTGNPGAEEFADAPLGLQNRCRIVRMIRDVEVMDRIEAEEPVVEEEDGSVEKKRHYGRLWGLDSLV